MPTDTTPPPVDLPGLRAREDLTLAEMGTALGYTGSDKTRANAAWTIEHGRRPLRGAALQLARMYMIHGVPAWARKPEGGHDADHPAR